MSKYLKLEQVVESLIQSGKEGTYWDFKRKHHRNNSKLIHDVLCLANAEQTGRRYLIMGVDDSDFSLCSVDNDPNRPTQAEIAGLFRDNASKFFQSSFPTFFLEEVVLHGESLDVLVIEDVAKKPFYLTEPIEKIRAHHIYTRLLDTNTPVDKAAPPHEIERMWRERFGLDSPPLERVKRYLLNTASWKAIEQNGPTEYYYSPHPEFTIREVNDEEHSAHNEEWTSRRNPTG